MAMREYPQRAPSRALQRAGFAMLVNVVEYCEERSLPSNSELIFSKVPPSPFLESLENRPCKTELLAKVEKLPQTMGVQKLMKAEVSPLLQTWP